MMHGHRKFSYSPYMTELYINHITALLYRQTNQQPNYSCDISGNLTVEKSGNNSKKQIFTTLKFENNRKGTISCFPAMHDSTLADKLLFWFHVWENPQNVFSNGNRMRF